MHTSEILAIIVVVAIIALAVAWVVVGRRRAKRAERPRLKLKDLRLPVDDWRFMVPPEWRTQETERLVR